MATNRVAVITKFNGHYFEKFSTVQQGTEDAVVTFAIDGIEVGELEWTQKRDADSALDKARSVSRK